jgi:hypothetical protein
MPQPPGCAVATAEASEIAAPSAMATTAMMVLRFMIVLQSCFPFALRETGSSPHRLHCTTAM